MSKAKADQVETSDLPSATPADPLLLLTGIGRSLLDLLYPPKCIICDSLDTQDCLCASCIKLIEPVEEPACPTCGLTMQPGGEQPGMDTRSPFENRTRKSTAHLVDPSIPSPFFCPHCTERTPAFDCAGSLGVYRGVLRDAIHHLKYRDKPQLAGPLAHLLADYAKSHSSRFHDLQFDAVIAIPMHPSRRRQRGYNQAERLAAAFAKAMGLKLDTNLIKRSRKTKSQVGLTARERANNITGAFDVPNSEIAFGKIYFLIDDVTTTGSTLHECAKVLKEAGAKSVYALTLAAD